MKRECETCIKRKTPYCPTSIDCMATDDMPYYQNRIMLLEENQELKKQLEKTQKCLKDMYHINIENDKKLDKKETQQKEFIDYLENEKDRLIKECSHHYTDSFDRQHAVNEDMYNEVDKNLLKYKSIIGVLDEESNNISS